MSDTPSGVARKPLELGPFEFSAEDNKVFRNLALRMRIVGVALLTWGILQSPRIFGSGDIGAIILALGLLVAGVWTIRAAHGFRAVDQTEGADITHLMDALKSVLKLYSLVASIIAVIVVWIAIALGFALFVALA